MEKCANSREPVWVAGKRRCRGNGGLGADVSGTQEMLGKVCDSLGAPEEALGAGWVGEAEKQGKVCKTLAALEAAWGGGLPGSH